MHGTVFRNFPGFPLFLELAGTLLEECNNNLSKASTKFIDFISTSCLYKVVIKCLPYTYMQQPLLNCSYPNKSITHKYKKTSIC